MLYESEYYGLCEFGGSLTHHGIKGQRWGVRRFQNYDGTYTQAGLKRYNKAAEKYANAKDVLAKAKLIKKAGPDRTGVYVTDNAINKAKTEVKRAKLEEKHAYRELKLSNRADKGKQLYREGKTITDIERKQMVANTGLGAAQIASVYAFQYYGLPLVEAIMGHRSFSSVPKSSIASGAAMVSLMAASGILNARWDTQKKYLRAYYTR